MTLIPCAFSITRQGFGPISAEAVQEAALLARPVRLVLQALPVQQEQTEQQAQQEFTAGMQMEIISTTLLRM